MASADGERGRSTNLPAAQAHRTRAWHHQEPRHVAVPGAWPRKGPWGLPAAGTGAQSWLGRYPAAPYCRGRCTGMIATGRNSSGVRTARFLGLPSNPSPDNRARYTWRLRLRLNDTSCPKPGLAYTLVSGNPERQWLQRSLWTPAFGGVRKLVIPERPAGPGPEAMNTRFCQYVCCAVFIGSRLAGFTRALE